MKMEDKSVRSMMGELRLKCENDIQSHQHFTSTCLNSFRNSLESQSSIARSTFQNQGLFLLINILLICLISFFRVWFINIGVWIVTAKLGELKAQLRAAEDDFVKALACNFNSRPLLCCFFYYVLLFYIFNFLGACVYFWFFVGLLLLL